MTRTFAAFAAAAFSLGAALNAQTANSTEKSRGSPAAPEQLPTITGCLEKTSDEKFRLTQATVTGLPAGAPASTTWQLDVTAVVRSFLHLDERVGQRL